jgi:CRISP-associated protein Cas1
MPIIQHLVVDEYGCHVGKHQERLQVTDHKTGKKVIEAPLLHLESVLVGGHGVSISADAIAACTERGIPIHFLDPHGEPYASLYSAGLSGTVLTRRAQLRAFDGLRGRLLALAICGAKLHNQAHFLRYAAKYRKETEPAKYDQLRLLADEVLDCAGELEHLGGETVDDVRGQLLSAEGRGAEKYWAGVGLLLRESYEWPGRRRRGAKDAVNCTLNYGYGILYSVIERSLVLAGLDPYAGFIHVDRSGKPSLVLDLIEEFRAPVVDRVVISIINKGTPLVLGDDGLLAADTRRQIAEKLFERLDGPIRHEGKQQTLRNLIQVQARRVAVYLREGEHAYVPFAATW